jgi:WhiB family transcriptional regulator, redox-sensing transcriptional regulator
LSDLEWQTGAVCGTVGLEIFYSGEPEDVRAAVGICRGCPVRGACLEAAVDRGEWFGVWGGTTERERRRMIRDRSAREAAA